MFQTYGCDWTFDWCKLQVVVTVELRSSKVVSCISISSEERLTKASTATSRRQNYLEVQGVKEHGSRQ
jgi:hypothetical protein